MSTNDVATQHPATAANISSPPSFNGTHSFLDNSCTSRSVDDEDDKKNVLDCISQDGDDFGRSMIRHVSTESPSHGVQIKSSTAHLVKDQQTRNWCSPNVPGEAASFPLVSPAVQKLKSFKFVKVSRKRSSESQDIDMGVTDTMPPLKRPRSVNTHNNAPGMSGKLPGKVREDGQLKNNLDHYGGKERTSEDTTLCQSTSSLSCGNTAALKDTATSSLVDMAAAGSSSAATKHSASQRSVGSFCVGCTDTYQGPPTPVCVNRNALNCAPVVQPCISPLTLSQTRFPNGAPLRSIILTTPISRIAMPVRSTPYMASSATNLKYLTPQQSMRAQIPQQSSQGRHPLPSLPILSSKTAVSPPIYPTCRNKRLPSSAAAMICTPSDGPVSSGGGMMGTPVPLPRRRFPGPAGLLPPLVCLLCWLIYSQ